MYAPSIGDVGAAKYTQPAARDSTVGKPRSCDATGPSVATTIALAEIWWPFASVTE